MPTSRLMLSFGLLAVTAACGMRMMPAAVPAAAPAVPLAAPAAPLAPRDRLVAAIESNGCLLTAGNVGTILLQANLTQDQLLAITQDLAAEGQAEVAADGAIRVLTENCI